MRLKSGKKRLATRLLNYTDFYFYRHNGNPRKDPFTFFFFPSFLSRVLGRDVTFSLGDLPPSPPTPVQGPPVSGRPDQWNSRPVSRDTGFDQRPPDRQKFPPPPAPALHRPSRPDPRRSSSAGNCVFGPVNPAPENGRTTSYFWPVQIGPLYMYIPKHICICTLKCCKEVKKKRVDLSW